MIIDKNNISEDDKAQAVRILNSIRNGKRVFGSPGEGLKITLRNLERELRCLV